MMSIPIRVLNIFQVLDRGGAETLVMNIYRKINRDKIQFDFLVHGEKKGAYEEEIKALGGRIFRMPEIKLKNLWTYNKQLKQFFTDHREYSIVHAHNSELGLFALRQAKIAEVPCRICHAHSVPRGIGLNVLLRFIFKKLTLRYINKGFSCSKDAGIWQFGKNTEFQVITNGIDTEKFQFSEDVRLRMRKELRVENNFVLGHVGRFEKAKNHRFLIEIFEKVVKKRSEAVLILIGNGSLLEEIESVVIRKKLNNKVKFLGTKDNIADYMQAFDLFLFPSNYEGLGIVAIESQATGLPCLCSDKVPQDVALTEKCAFLKLNAIDEWVNNIVQIKATSRMNSNVLVKNAGYDIISTVSHLEKFYLSH